MAAKKTKEKKTSLKSLEKDLNDFADLAESIDLDASNLFKK